MKPKSLHLSPAGATNSSQAGQTYCSGDSDRKHHQVVGLLWVHTGKNILEDEAIKHGWLVALFIMGAAVLLEHANGSLEIFQGFPSLVHAGETHEGNLIEFAKRF